MNISTRTLLLSAAAAVAILVAVSTRYEVTTAPNGVAYKLDRWTGQVVFLKGADAREAKAPPAPIDWSQFKPEAPR